MSLKPKVLSYGGVKKLCEQLQLQVSSLNLRIKFLTKESSIQSQVIQQLKTLHASTKTQMSNICCDAGHKRCKIQHKLYNYVNGCINTNTKLKLAQMSPPIKSESLFYKKLSKKIDAIQYKYGAPSIYTDKIFVASADTVFIKSQEVKS